MKKNKFPFTAILSLATLFAVVSCENPLAYQEDAHGRGKQVLYLEESYKPLFETSIYTFESQFPKANIVPEYCTQDEAIKALFDKKTNTICIARDLNKLEKASLKKASIEVRSTKIAYDAVALLIHPDNPDSILTVAELKQILKGQIATWKGSGLPINVVFDNVNSANFQYLHELADKAAVPANVFAVKSNEEVIKYVKEHPSALGIIGVNWISDEDDKAVVDFRSGIKIMALGKTAGGSFYQPYQAYIHTKEYPLTREVWLINKGSRSGLNTGFVNWMQGEHGQLIIQKSALIPANAVVRMIQMNEE